jgi:CRP-like cAMP-binding protein
MKFNRTPPDVESRVVQLIGAKRLTRTEIAQECGISRRTLYRIARRFPAPQAQTAGAK